MNRRYHLPPSAARLTRSLRDIGYDFETAVADLVDNSIAAGARHVDIEIAFHGLDSYVAITDDGSGMSLPVLDEAMRFGSRRDYEDEELGRYGLGLKTASISQARTVTVVTNVSDTASGYIRQRRLCLDHVEDTDRWEVLDPGDDPEIRPFREALRGHTGTTVLWTGLDRVLSLQDPEGGWAARRFARLARTTGEHLAMVFHRYLDGSLAHRVRIDVNGTRVEPWDPYLQHPATESYAVRRVPVPHSGGRALRWAPHVLPPRSEWDQSSWERAAGPARWNKQQGLYVYRADRIIQAGGWAGLRGIDEHTKLARVALDVPTGADELFSVDVAKMRISVPSSLRGPLRKLITDVCNEADARYRSGRRRPDDGVRRLPTGPAGPSMGELYAAATRTGVPGDLEALARILRELEPDVRSA